jgi:HEAT repeat protein
MKINRKRSTARQRKAQLRELLQRRDHEALLAWSDAEPHAVRTVFSALFEADELLRWRAIEALGLLAEKQSYVEQETIREWIRRLLWNMNDESGGLMWHGPEAIAEILFRVQELVAEFVMILNSFHEEEPFEAGTYIGLARLAELVPRRVRPFAGLLAKGLTDPDPRIRAHAARIHRLTGELSATAELERVLADETPLTVYDHGSGQLRETTVGAHAAG